MCTDMSENMPILDARDPGNGPSMQGGHFEIKGPIVKAFTHDQLHMYSG